MKIRRYLVSTTERRQYTPGFYKFKCTDVNLLSCLVCLSDKNGRFGIIIGQIACQSNSLRRVNSRKHTHTKDKLSSFISGKYFFNKYCSFCSLNNWLSSDKDIKWHNCFNIYYNKKFYEVPNHNFRKILKDYVIMTAENSALPSQELFTLIIIIIIIINKK